MRDIGQLPDEPQARAFSEFLVGKKIPNEIEHHSGSAWTVWIKDEAHVTEAQEALARFQADPNGAEFRNASKEASRVRKAHAEELAEYNRRVKTRRSLFPKMGGYGIGILTFGLVFFCVIVAVLSSLGADKEFLRPLYISDPFAGLKGFLPEVRAGEVWRLFTPIFIHFGIIHIGFNCIWLFQLGSMIEARQGALKLTLIIAVVALLSNLSEYGIAGHKNFGGMSGVVYGLAGYVWIRGAFDKKSGLYLDTQSVVILLVWLVVCFTGRLQVQIANAAHLSGLIVGMAWGGLSAFHASGKSE